MQLKKHNLDANLKLRIKKEELAKVEEEIKELEGHMEILNYDELRVQKAQLEKKKKNLEEQVIIDLFIVLTKMILNENNELCNGCDLLHVEISTFC